MSEQVVSLVEHMSIIAANVAAVVVAYRAGKRNGNH